jgi:hypothetical protein
MCWQDQMANNSPHPTQQKTPHKAGFLVAGAGNHFDLLFTSEKHQFRFSNTTNFD